MAQLPLPEAINRFKENEERTDTFVNGTAEEVVTPNNGNPSYSTQAGAVAKMENVGGLIGAPNLTALQAITPAYSNQLGVDESSSFLYRWNPSVVPPTWVDTGLKFNFNTAEFATQQDFEFKYENQNYVSGVFRNFADKLISGYINKTNGVLTASSGYYATNFIQVTNTSRLRRYGTLIGAGSSAAAVAFYDSNKNFLGAYTDAANNFDIRADSLFANTKYVRFSYQSTGTTTINVNESNLFINDFFESNTVSGYVNVNGGFVSGGNWVTTALVPCKLNQSFRFEGQGSTGVVSAVSSFDEQGNFLESLYSMTGVTSKEIVITNPLAKFIKASAATTAARKLTGVFIPTTQPSYSVMAPTEVYALQNERLCFYSDGIVQGLDNLAFNLSESNYKLAQVTPTSTSDVNVKIRAIGALSQSFDLASFSVKVTGTPINPASQRFVMCLGDSTTDGVALSNIEGAYVNELSRRLNGTGRQILDNQYSPSPLAMTNLKFIGTRGSEAVKHEGRGGWRASTYLNSASLGGITNAFWNPNSGQFDLSYYMTQNGFSEVSTTGDNLTIIIWLGWNDVYNSNANQAAADLGLLIDKIRGTHPNTDIICLGLNQAPDVNIKTFVGERFVSKREVFESIKSFKNSYRKMIDTKTNVKFLQISQSLNSTDGYNYITRSISNRSATTINGCFDHVHLNAVGYANVADIVFYYILYRYCRG